MIATAPRPTPRPMISIAKARTVREVAEQMRDDLELATDAEALVELYAKRNARPEIATDHGHPAWELAQYVIAEWPFLPSTDRLTPIIERWS